jgi:hypothetical protein
MSIALAQSNNAGNATACTYTAAQVAGNCNIVGMNSSTAFATGCLDTLGNAYTLDVQYLQNGRYITILHAPNIAAAAAGGNVVTPQGSGNKSIILAEVSGLGMTPTIDGNVQNFSTSNSSRPSLAITAAQAVEFLFSLLGTGTNQTAMGASSTFTFMQTAGGAAGAYQIISATGTYTCQYNTSANWNMVLLGFVPGGLGAPPVSATLIIRRRRN